MRQSGFSLIELVVVMAIIALVATLAVPTMGQLIESSRITSTTNSFIEAVAISRSESVRTKAQVTVVPIGGWSDGWQVQRADNSVVQVFDPVPNGITFSATPVLPLVTFESSGIRTTGGAATTIRICGASGKGREVVMLATGSTTVTTLESGCT